ncbi:ADP-ribosylglycohydrolase family protein [Streptomyces sp. M19]
MPHPRGLRAAAPGGHGPGRPGGAAGGPPVHPVTSPLRKEARHDDLHHPAGPVPGGPRHRCPRRSRRGRRARRPVEGWSPQAIAERHGGRVRGIVGPFHGDGWRTARPIAPYHKGDGHVTDDTLMTHALIRVYEKVRDHLDAYAVADHLVPDLITTTRWIPELEAEALPSSGSSSPRSGSSPGSTTATSTRARRAWATSSTAVPRCTWRRSARSTRAIRWGVPGGPGRRGRAPVVVRARAAGVFAAAVASAFARTRPGVGGRGRVETGEGRDEGGDRGGVRRGRPPRRLRGGAGPAARGGGAVRHGRPGVPRPSLGARRPSRLHSIEELPIALGMVLVGGATSGTRCSGRSTTAATATRSPR